MTTTVLQVPSLSSNSTTTHGFQATRKMSEFTGIQYLKMDVASGFGLDKEDWSVRLFWFDEMEASGAFSTAEGIGKLLQEADKPVQFLAALKAYYETMEGKPVGHLISLDATASCIQILSLLIGCEKSASHCNVVNTGHRVDPYTILPAIIRDKGIAKGIEQAFSLARSVSKQAIMTAFYGSKKLPKDLFDPMGMLDLFYETMNQETPGAWKLNEVIMELWDPTISRYEWVLPDNFHAGFNVEVGETTYVRALGEVIAVHRTVVASTEKGKALCPNLVHSIDGYIVRELTRRAKHDPEVLGHVLKLISGFSGSRVCDTISHDMVQTLLEHFRYSGMLSARILDHLDRNTIRYVQKEEGAMEALYELCMSMPDKPFEVIAVHDCFRVHANNGNALRRIYNQVLSEIAKSNLLQFTVSQAVGKLVPKVKISDLSQAVLEADYALA